MIQSSHFTNMEIDSKGVSGLSIAIETSVSVQRDDSLCCFSFGNTSSLTHLNILITVVLAFGGGGFIVYSFAFSLDCKLLRKNLHPS